MDGIPLTDAKQYDMLESLLYYKHDDDSDSGDSSIAKSENRYDAQETTLGGSVPFLPPVDRWDQAQENVSEHIDYGDILEK